MKRTEWKITAVLIVCLVMLTGITFAEDAAAKNVTGEVRFRSDYTNVNGDNGRFREDNWMTDGFTGGLDWLHLENTDVEEDGYEWVLSGRAIHDYNYGFDLLLRKPYWEKL